MPPKLINMRDPKEIDKPLKMMRNTQTKLLRQATPEEIAGAIAKIDGDKKKAKQKAEAKKAAEAEKAEEAKKEEPKEEPPKDEAPKDEAPKEAPKEEASTSEADKASEAVSASDQKTEAPKEEKASEADKTAIEQNFYWIKHAESVANLYNNEETDKYKDAGIQKELLAEKNKYRLKGMAGGDPGDPPERPAQDKPADLIENDERTKTDPTIIELMNWLKEKTDEKKKPKTFDATWAKVEPFCQVNDAKYDPKVSSAKISEIKEEADRTLAYIKWLMQIVFYWAAQPVLTPGGMVQARILGEQLKKKEIKPDTILCAATVPAMMTAYLTALYAELPDITIYPVPYVNDKENEAAIMFKGTNFHDYANYGIKPDDMTAVGSLILRWLSEKSTDGILQIYDTTGMTIEDLREEKNKPIFDYTYYKGGDELRNSATPEEFFKWFDTTPLKEKANVWVFSYDTPIKAIRKQSLAGAIDDSKNPNFWDTNTAVFQHKRQGTALQAIFPKDAPPKLTMPFAEELAECGLIYYPNAGVENTVIRSGKDVKGLLLMDKTDDNQELLKTFYEAISNITHQENAADTDLKKKYNAEFTELLERIEESFAKLPIANKINIKLPNGVDMIDPEKSAYLAKADIEYNKIKGYMDSYRATKQQIEDDEEQANEILREELKDFYQRVMDYQKKYGTPLPVEDDSKTINEGFKVALDKKLAELHEISLKYMKLDTKKEKKTLPELEEIKKLRESANTTETETEKIEKEKEEYNKFKGRLEPGEILDLKTRYPIKGGGTGSRKKRSKKAKKSIRNNRKQRKHKSKKQKKHVKKYTKRK